MAQTLPFRRHRDSRRSDRATRFAINIAHTRDGMKFRVGQPASRRNSDALQKYFVMTMPTPPPQISEGARRLAITPLTTVTIPPTFTGRVCRRQYDGTLLASAEASK